MPAIQGSGGGSEGGSEGGSAEPPAGTLLVATFGRPHGVRGEMRLNPESGRPERLLGLKSLWLRTPVGDRIEKHRVVSIRVHQDIALAMLEGIADRDVAAGWTNAEAWALESELPPLAANEFGMDEVVGWELFDVDARIGPVTGVATNAGRDYFEVEHEGRSILVPAIKEWLLEMDRPGRRVRMRLPAGLVDQT